MLQMRARRLDVATIFGEITRSLFTVPFGFRKYR